VQRARIIKGSMVHARSEKIAVRHCNGLVGSANYFPPNPSDNSKQGQIKCYNIYYKTSKNTKIDIRTKRMHKTRRFYIYNGRQRKSHHLNVSVKKTLITHLDFDVTQK
jgi:hypothetical protein